MDTKLKLTMYLAAAIEHNPEFKTDNPSEDWKVKVKKELNNSLIGIYDPVERESQKTNKQSGQTCEYIKSLKRSGHWEQFHAEMKKIWWGRIIASGIKIFIMWTIRQRFLIDGNEIRDLDYWGDYEAVLRSNFIIAYKEKNVKTVGTICEIHTCYLFNIPVYLILPDQTKTEENSTLVDMVHDSGGEIFYSINDCIFFIKNKYNL